MSKSNTSNTFNDNNQTKDSDSGDELDQESNCRNRRRYYDTHTTEDESDTNIELNQNDNESASNSSSCSLNGSFSGDLNSKSVKCNLNNHHRHNCHQYNTFLISSKHTKNSIATSAKIKSPKGHKSLNLSNDSNQGAFNSKITRKRLSIDEKDKHELASLLNTSNQMEKQDCNSDNNLHFNSHQLVASATNMNNINSENSYQSNMAYDETTGAFASNIESKLEPNTINDPTNSAHSKHGILKHTSSSTSDMIENALQDLHLNNYHLNNQNQVDTQNSLVVFNRLLPSNFQDLIVNTASVQTVQSPTTSLSNTSNSFIPIVNTTVKTHASKYLT